MGPPTIDEIAAAAAHDRTLAPPVLKAKHVRQFDAQVWNPARCTAAMSYLELGCGTGLFLAYLLSKGVRRMIGIDREPLVLDQTLPAVATHMRVAEVDAFLADPPAEPVDRIVMLDVLEHFTPQTGVALLAALRRRLAPGGKVVVRVPNASSPWGLRHQFGDLTHRATYTPDSLRQAAVAAGYAPPLCLPVRRHRGLRAWLHVAVEKMARLAFDEVPVIWTATFVAVLEPRKS